MEPMDLELNGMPNDDTVSMVVTPEMAREWLKKNNINREYRPARAARYAREILAGNWMDNGENIKWSDTGWLLDGQHRLNAIIIADRPMRLRVAYNVDEKAFDTIDQGLPRSSADAVKTSGIQNSKMLAAAARMLFMYDHGGNPAFISSKKAPTAREILETIKHHPDLARHCNAMENKKTSIKRLLSASHLACLRYIFSRDSGEHGEMFIDKLIRGDNISATNPVYHLREFLFESYVTKKGTIDRKLRMTFKAYKKWRANESVSILRFPQKGSQEFKNVYRL